MCLVADSRYISAMVLDRRQVEAILERALELDSAGLEATFDIDTVQRLADELGVSSAALTTAIGEVGIETTGPLAVVAQSTIAAPVADVDAALAAFLRLRGLHTEGSSVWRQDSGWWPDLYRFTAVTPVATSLAAADDGTVVRMTARLDRVWRGHALAALLALLLLGLSVLTGSGPSDILGTVVLGAIWLALVAWTYYARREAIQRRLAGAITDVSGAAYRRNPW